MRFIENATADFSNAKVMDNYFILADGTVVSALGHYVACEVKEIHLDSNGDMKLGDGYAYGVVSPITTVAEFNKDNSNPIVVMLNDYQARIMCKLYDESSAIIMSGSREMTFMELANGEVGAVANNYAYCCIFRPSAEELDTLKYSGVNRASLAGTVTRNQTIAEYNAGVIPSLKIKRLIRADEALKILKRADLL